jgi:hypothetical protein
MTASHSPALGTLPAGLERFGGIALPAQLLSVGIKAEQIAAHIQQLRWRRIAGAIVLHYGPLDADQQRRLALLGHRGPALLASFTALESYGLQGWQRPEIHVLALEDSPAFQHPELPLIITHRSPKLPGRCGRDLEPAASAAIRAAASCPTARLACGVLVAAVNQGVVAHWLLRDALDQTRIELPHRCAMLTAVADMGQGHDALIDIDFVDLCGRYQLPGPLRQRRLSDRAGRRRFLEAIWELPDGRALVVEADCALQLTARRWWGAQLSASDLIPCANGVVRIPSAVVRHEPELLLGLLGRRLHR